MTEETPKDTSPEEYSGGAREPDEAKGGTGELAKGVVPDDAKEDQPPDPSEPQALGTQAQGDFPDEAQDAIDTSAGDEADATSHGRGGLPKGTEGRVGEPGEES